MNDRPHTLPNQPQITPTGGFPGYYNEADSYIPKQISPVRNWKEWNKNVKENWKQVIPTSINVRNRQLQELISQYKTPLQSLITGGLQDAAVGQRANSLESLAGNTAGRGLYSSGLQDLGTRSVELDYLTNTAKAGQAGQQKEQMRRTDLLKQILNVPAQDLDFYSAIRGGTGQASSQFSDNSQNYEQLFNGVGSLIKSLATYGMGGGAGVAADMAGGAGGFSAGAGGGSSMFGGGAFGGAS